MVLYNPVWGGNLFNNLPSDGNNKPNGVNTNEKEKLSINFSLHIFPF